MLEPQCETAASTASPADASVCVQVCMYIYILSLRSHLSPESRGHSLSKLDPQFQPAPEEMHCKVVRSNNSH